MNFLWNSERIVSLIKPLSCRKKIFLNSDNNLIEHNVIHIIHTHNNDYYSYQIEKKQNQTKNP